MKESLKTTVIGEVLIKDETGNVLLNKKNAIHPANMATAIARGLSNSPNFQIFKLKLGNQGTYVDSSQQIVFRPANTSGISADLYNPTWVEIVDEKDAKALQYPGNSVTYTNTAAGTSRVIVTCVISANEAVNRTTDQADSTTTSFGGLDGVDTTPTEGTYFFDELGLFTSGDNGALLKEENELMLSHLVFSPIEHTGNRELTIVYTLTIQVS